MGRECVDDSFIKDAYQRIANRYKDINKGASKKETSKKGTKKAKKTGK